MKRFAWQRIRGPLNAAGAFSDFWFSDGYMIVPALRVIQTTTSVIQILSDPASFSLWAPNQVRDGVHFVQAFDTLEQAKAGARRHRRARMLRRGVS